MINLFEALRYSGEENQCTALFAAVFCRLSPRSQRHLLGVDVPELRLTRVELQPPLAGAVPDAMFAWSDAAIAYVESKVDQPLTVEELVVYARGLSELSHYSKRWLIALTRDDVSDIIRDAHAQIESGPGDKVDLLPLKWQQLADRAMQIADQPDTVGIESGSLEATLLQEFALRLYNSGLAARPVQTDLVRLARALPDAHALLALRLRLERWFEALLPFLPGRPGWWSSGSRSTRWTAFSVRAERWVPLASSLNADGKGAVWFLEFHITGHPDPLAWPPGKGGGLLFRMGFYLEGVRPVAIGSQRFEEALKDPPPPAVFRTYAWKSRYVERWWYLQPDLDDLPSFARKVLSTLALQAEAASHLLDPSLGRPQELPPLTRLGE